MLKLTSEDAEIIRKALRRAKRAEPNNLMYSCIRNAVNLPKIDVEHYEDLEFEKVQLQPGDKIIVRVNRKVKPDYANKVLEIFREWAGDKINIVVIPMDIDYEVARPSPELKIGIDEELADRMRGLGELPF